MRAWLQRWRETRTLEKRAIPEPLWQLTLARFPFLSYRNAGDVARLRDMATLFLARKEFSGAHGLVVDDEMAVAIAAQACVPVLELGLDWYDGFVGIVVHAGQVVAQRSEADESGVVHEYTEVLAGEAVQGGPVMLSWHDVRSAGSSAALAYNVVIHEFAHVLDMENGVADGMPLLPNELPSAQWRATLGADFERFSARVDRVEDTALDPYGAHGIEEFFAVASEAFFVSPLTMQREHPVLYALFARFYRQDPALERPPQRGG